MPGPIEITPEQSEQLRTQISQLQELLQSIDQLEECGLDCQRIRHEARMLHDRMQKVLEKFGAK